MDNMQTVLDSLGAQEVLRMVGANATEAFLATLSPLDLIKAIQASWCDKETADFFSRALRGVREVEFSVYLTAIDRWHSGGSGNLRSTPNYTLHYLLERMRGCATTTFEWLHCAQVASDLGEGYIAYKQDCLDSAVVAATDIPALVELFLWSDDVVDSQRRGKALASLQKRRDPANVWVEALRDNAESVPICELVLKRLRKANGLVLVDWICVVDSCRNRGRRIHSQLTELAQGKIQNIVTSLCANDEKGEEG